MIFQINEQNPQKRFINKTVDILESDGVIIYPTDTVYAYGCDICSKQAIEKLYRLKKIDRKKPLSFMFTDISQINEYVRNMSNDAFKALKKLTPGPYTFIFQASKLVPRLVLTKQKTVGIRIPDNNIALDIVNQLGRPILSAGINKADGDYIDNPSELEKQYRNDVDLVIDAGIKKTDVSTIIDYSSGRGVLVRSGCGSIAGLKID